MDHRQDSEQRPQRPLEDNELRNSTNETIVSTEHSPEKDWSEDKHYQEPPAPIAQDSESSEDFYEISHAKKPASRVSRADIVLWGLRSAVLLNVVIYVAVLYLGGSTALVQASSPEAMHFFAPKNAEVQSLVFESRVGEDKAQKRLSQTFAQGIDLYGTGPKGLGR